MIDTFHKFIKFVVMLIVLAAWAVIGFILWIPLLTRMMAYFVGMVAASSFRKINLQLAENSLNFAIEFYINGFRRILHLLSDNSADIDNISPMADTRPIGGLDFLKSVAVDVVWTIVFWIITSIAIATKF